MLDTRAMIFDCKPIPTLPSIPIERKGLIVDRIGHEKRNELFGILVRAVGVTATRDYHGKLVRGPVTQREQVPSCLTRRVGTAGFQAIVFTGGTDFHTPVHLVCTDLKKTPYAGAFGRFDQDAGSHNISPRKAARIQN